MQKLKNVYPCDAAAGAKLGWIGPLFVLATGTSFGNFIYTTIFCNGTSLS